MGDLGIASRDLTDGLGWRINGPVNRAMQWMIWAFALTVGPMAARADGVPPQAMKNAAAATKVLGDQVLRTNFSYVFQKMYPRYKARAAKAAGGEEKLAEKLAKIPEQMKKDGIVILSFDVGAPTSAFAVPQFGEWLVFVPTTKVYIVPDVQRGVNRRIESKGYQIAISKTGGTDWYFIDGANISIRELRSIFPTMPKDEKTLNLPPVSQKEIK